MATTQHQNGAAGIGSILPSLIDQVQDALIFLDRNYTVVDYSEGAERISGWSRDEVLGKNFTSDFEWDFAATEDGRRVWADLWAATPTRARARVRRKDAAWLELDIALTPVAEGAEQPAGWLLIARDMTAEATPDPETRRTRSGVGCLLPVAGVRHGGSRRCRPIRQGE